MTFSEAVRASYEWLVAHGDALLVGAIALPAAGTLLSRVGKAGKTDADGKFIASTVVGLALAAVAVEALGLILARAALGLGLLDLDVRVTLAPLICLAGCLFGIRWVFPLSELGSVRTFRDVGLFVVACAVVGWLFSKFRGWGFLFIGGIGEALALAALAFALLHRLYRQAMGGRPPVA